MTEKRLIQGDLYMGLANQARNAYALLRILGRIQ